MTPANPDALADALARELARLDGWQDPDTLWTDNLGAIARGGAGSPVYLDYVEDAGKLIAGPLAPFLADLQRVTAEYDRGLDHRNDLMDRVISLKSSVAAAEARAAQLQAEVEAKDKRIAELSETWTDEGGTVWSPPTAWAYAKACAALNKHRAEVEAKDRAFLLMLPFVDYAAGEGLMFAETEAGEHPAMDAADIMAAVAEALGLELGGDAYLAMLPAGYDAIRASRAATAREGQAASPATSPDSV